MLRHIQVGNRLEGRRRVGARRLAPDHPVVGGDIGPIAFHRDDGEAVLGDEAPRDRGARGVKFMRPMAAFAEHDDALAGESIEDARELGILDRGQRDRGSRDRFGQGSVSAPAD